MSLVEIIVSLSQVLLLAVLLERAFSVLFESHYYITSLARWRIKELIVFAASVFVCHYWKIDLMKVIAGTHEITIPGIIITAAMMTGLTKASTKLFRDILAFRSQAYNESTYERLLGPLENQKKMHRESSISREDHRVESKSNAPPWFAEKVIEAAIKILVAVVSAALLLWLGLNK